MIADAPNWLFSACSFVSFLLCMIPLPWHLEGNSIIIQYRLLLNASFSLEYGYLHVHAMGGYRIIEYVHQFDGLEFGRHR